MVTLLIEFIDIDVGIEEYNGKWEIKKNCLICYGLEKDDTIQTIIPLTNILKMIEYIE